MPWCEHCAAKRVRPRVLWPADILPCVLSPYKCIVVICVPVRTKQTGIPTAVGFEEGRGVPKSITQRRAHLASGHTIKTAAGVLDVSNPNRGSGVRQMEVLIGIFAVCDCRAAHSRARQGLTSKMIHAAVPDVRPSRR